MEKTDELDIQGGNLFLGWDDFNNGPFWMIDDGVCE